MNDRTAVILDASTVHWESVIPRTVLNVVSLYLNRNSSDEIQLIGLEACMVPPGCRDQNIHRDVIDTVGPQTGLCFILSVENNNISTKFLPGSHVTGRDAKEVGENELKSIERSNKYVFCSKSKNCVSHQVVLYDQHTIHQEVGNTTNEPEIDRIFLSFIGKKDNKNQNQKNGILL